MLYTKSQQILCRKTIISRCSDSSTNKFYHAQQILSVKLNPAPTPVINGHNQAGWENTNTFYILFQVLKVLIKICKMQRTGLLFHISLYISRYHFSQLFRTSFNIIRKKCSSPVFHFKCIYSTLLHS